MTIAAWITLAAPLASSFLLAFAGNAIPRRTAGVVATAFIVVSFGAAVYAFVAMWSRAPGDRSQVSTAWT